MKEFFICVVLISILSVFATGQEKYLQFDPEKYLDFGITKVLKTEIVFADYEIKSVSEGKVNKIVYKITILMKNGMEKHLSTEDDLTWKKWSTEINKLK